MLIPQTQFTSLLKLPLTGELTNIRPDSGLAKQLASHFAESKKPAPIQLTELDDELLAADTIGRFHWRKFGQKLLERMNEKMPQIFKKFIFLVSVNRQSSFQPERNQVMSFALKQDMPAKSIFTREDFFQVHEIEAETLAQEHGINIKDALFTVFAIPRENKPVK